MRSINDIIEILATTLYNVKTRGISVRTAFRDVCKTLSCRSDVLSREELFELAKRFVSKYYFLKCLSSRCGKESPSNKALARLFIYLQGISGELNLKPRLRKQIERDYPGLSTRLQEFNRACRYSYPQWLIEKLSSVLPPVELDSLLEALDKRVIWLRVNTLRIDIDRALKRLEERGVEYILDKQIPILIRVLRSRKPIRTLDLFREGQIVPQDKASVLVVYALNPEPGMTIYDFAAAPGIKTSLIMQLVENKARIVAIDYSPRRLEKMRLLLKRYGVDLSRVTLVLSDSRLVSLSQRGDLGLIDAPCSSSGAMGKDPAIKIRLEYPSIVDEMVEMQYSILVNSLRYVESAVYATCSLLPDEGEEVVSRTLSTVDFKLVEPKIDASTGYSRYGFYTLVKRTFPHIQECEGFFIARLER